MSNLIERVQRGLFVLAAKVQLRDCQLGARVATKGRVHVVADGLVSLGERTTFTSGLVPSVFIAHAGATLSFGAECMVNAGSRYEAYDRIVIGNRCLLASAVRIADRDGSARGPIIIEDDVWLAHGAVIRPGVRIGKGSVISAGSVVTTDVPEHSLAAGSPARSIPLRLVMPASPPAAQA